MLAIARRSTFATLLLLIMPLGVGFSGWLWHPSESTPVLYFLYLLTETISFPWGIVTNLLLCGWFIWCLRFRLKAAVILFCILSVVILAGQLTKSFIKQQTQEARPYVLWLGSHYGMDEKVFYQMKAKSRGQVVAGLVSDDKQLPLWLKKHWESDTGFAFPSGHTLYATSWALLGIALLWPRRHYKTVAALFLWALGVMASRLLLGMHWPRDLVVATLISYSLVLIATGLTQKFCEPFTVAGVDEQNEIKQRESSKTN